MQTALPAGPALDAALARFGHAAFRPGQREAIEALLRAGRLLLVAPTGGGKSLSYQLPATLLPGTTLVVSPLIALMHDQVAALERVGIAATYLASTLDAVEARRRLATIARGEHALVYVAPERLVQEGFRALLADLDCPLVAIDEAHCISEWGHDFRPEFLAIGEVLARLPKARVLACTATATPVVRDEIVAKLGLPPDTPQLVRGFARPNLALRAREIGGERERQAAVDAALAEALGAPGRARGCAIVYAPTRRAAEGEAARLAARGWRSACYHAGLDASVREAAQRAFRDGTLEAIVATNAFGMGIDRPDVRAVVHLGPPASLEAYYQEVGRAGRDGERALGLLLHAPADIPLRLFLIESPVEDRAPAPEVIEHKRNLFFELMRFAQGGSCRHDAILRYFGDEDETLAGCGICDVCVRLAVGGETAEDAEAATLVVRKALSAVARVNGRYGLKAAVALLRGAPDERLVRAGLDRTPTFGALRERSDAWLTSLLGRLVTAGHVEFSGERHPVVRLTPAGREVMLGARPPRVMLPQEEGTRPRGASGRRAGARPAEGDAVLTGDEQQLFDRLRAHRQRLASAQGVPPYVIAHDRTLRELARQRPRTPAELAGIHGMGPSRIERYGAGFLEAVRRFFDGDA